MLQDLDPDGIYLARVWDPAVSGPLIGVIRNGAVVDITARTAPTLSDLCALPDPVGYVNSAEGRSIGSVSDLATAPVGDLNAKHFLAPCDLQAIKACGVTFAGSMVERLIEERAAGDPAMAEDVRARVGAAIGDNLADVVPGSEDAEAVKQALIKEGLWSQYLEVGIGPDAEIFTKSQPLSAVGPGAEIGLHPRSVWNNPEPEIVLAVSPTGRIVGATLGNDVNLRDFEGRSALLLSKAKDNNASCAIGAFLRLLDETYTLEDVRSATVSLRVEGPDGFVLNGLSEMAHISRDPEDLVAQTIGGHHQYPDGFMLFLGTLFAPTEDRDSPGGGFTHKVGDVVTISSPHLGALTNTVALSNACAEWSFGTRALMRNLSKRDLI